MVSSKASAAAAAARAQDEHQTETSRGERDNILLSGVEVPDPVFFCTIEPPTLAKQAGQFQREQSQIYLYSASAALQTLDYLCLFL